MIKQGNQTLNGLTVHREGALAKCGFVKKDEARLKKAVEMLDASVGDRGERRADARG